MYVSLSEQFEKKIIFSYSKTENVKNVHELKHQILKKTLLKYGIFNNLEINSSAEISTKGTGLGSSSSFTIGLLNCLLKYRKENISKKKLAELSTFIEINLCKFPIGKQDQYIASYGGFKKFNFLKDGQVKVKNLNLEKKFENFLFDSIILVYTGKSRSSSKVLNNLSSRLKNQKSIHNKMLDMLDLVRLFEQNLKSQNINMLGNIIYDSWNLKKQLESNITNKNIDSIIETGMSLGAYGGKLLGAGGGGFVMFLSNSKTQKKIMNIFSNSIVFKVKLDHYGSKLIYY